MSILQWYDKQPPALKALKREAKLLKKAKPHLSLMEAQNGIAVLHGFEHWHHIKQSCGNLQQRLAQSKTNFSYRYSCVETPDKPDSATNPMRCLGFHALASTYWSQSESTQRLHTYVEGAPGPIYCVNWIAEHHARGQTFFAWLNTQAWSPVEINDLKNPNTRVFQLMRTTDAHVEVLEYAVLWQTLDEILRWILTFLTRAEYQNTPLEQIEPILRRAWNHCKYSGQATTCKNLIQTLTVECLITTPDWDEKWVISENVLSTIRTLLTQADIFNPSGTSTNLFSFYDLLNDSRVLVLDDGQSDAAVKRKALIAHLRAYCTERMAPMGENTPYDAPHKAHPIQHWYFSNITFDASWFHRASQFRGMGIATAYFYNTHYMNTSETHEVLLANTMTHLFEGASPGYAWLEYANNTMEPLCYSASTGFK